MLSLTAGTFRGDVMGKSSGGTECRSPALDLLCSLVAQPRSPQLD